MHACEVLDYLYDIFHIRALSFAIQSKLKKKFQL